MNTIKGIKRKLSSSKKFRYGSSAVVFTSVFVIFVLLVNVVLSVLDEKTGGLYADITSKQLYTVSEESKKALENVTLPIEIIFASPKDIVEGSDSLNSVKMLCDGYASIFDNITVSYKNVVEEVAYFNKFKTTSADVINSASLIVYCPSTGLSKIFSLTDNPPYAMSDMYKYSSETGRQFAFDGENKLTGAFLTVTGNNGVSLKAGFTSGHNEEINDSLKVFLEDNGYEVGNVDIKKTSSKELGEYDLIIICEPRSDFSGRGDGGVNEIELLRNYVTEDFGNLMLFTGYSGTQLPELYALFEESFGVKVNNSSLVVEGSKNAIAQTGGVGFFGSYSTDTGSYGYKIHKDFSEGQSRSYPVFDNCSLLKIVTENNDDINVSPIIVTSNEASSFDGKNTTALKNQPLMTLTKYTKLVNSEEQNANVVVCASSSFPYYLQTPAYSNSDIMSSMLSQFSSTTAVRIDFKVLDETSITVTKQMNDSMTIKLAVVIPAVIAVIGAVVFIKRKYL